MHQRILFHSNSSLFFLIQYHFKFYISNNQNSNCGQHIEIVQSFRKIVKTTKKIIYYLHKYRRKFGKCNWKIKYELLR